MATNVVLWPAANAYMEAIQNPHLCFSDPTLRQSTPALDRLGMPVVTTGNFAYVFKLHVGNRARAIKCFRQFLGDREVRYQAIDQYLDAHNISALAEFEYEPDGIAVAGKRYPIVTMEWVDGNTLDVYVGTLIKDQKAKDHLKPLAEQWSELVSKLETANVAHGDLQHGNVIVTPSGSLRLVDLDGMYVPALNGRQTTELGHIHFQHPKRAQAPFDQRLDRFSSLVIYVSVLALDQDPSLWDRFHDDNLILNKTDFADPAKSPLLNLMRRQGGEVARLTDVLVSACKAPSLATTPMLSSLVQIKHSKLPQWMRPSSVVTVQTKTREASPVVQTPSPTVTQPAQRTSSGWWKGAATTQTSPTSPTPQTAVASREWFGPGLKRGFRLAVWYWWIGLLSSGILLSVVQSIGVAESNAWFVAIVLYGWLFLCLGLILEAKQVKVQTRANVGVPAPAGAVPITTKTVSVPVPASTPPVSTVPPITTRTVSIPIPAASPWRPQSPVGGGTANRVVGNRIRLVYHRPGCEWAAKISNRNRVPFTSAQQAVGYRPCKVCNP